MRRSAALVAVREPEDPVTEFNAEQWAKQHDEMDRLRFSAIFKVLTIGGLSLLGVLGWSLQTQFAAMDRQVRSSEVQLQAIQELKAQLVVSKAPQFR